MSDQQQFGVHARDLIMEIKRAKEHGSQEISLPAYNDHLVRNALQDLQIHVQALNDQVEATAGMEKIPEQIKPSIFFQKAAINRNKRCLLAYHNARIDIMTAAYWTSQDVKESGSMAPAEQAFYGQFERLVQNYVMEAGVEDDLRATMHPPQPVDKVQVRVCIGSQGPIVLESGQTVDLVKGSVHYLLFTDVESMLRDGSVEMLAAEEDISRNPSTTAVAAM